MPRPRKDDPRALTLPLLGRAYVRLCLEQGTPELPLAALAEATGVSRQSVWERAQRPGWRAAIGEAVVERIEWRRGRAGPWRRRVVRLVADVSASLASRPLLLPYVGATCFLSPAWRPVLRELAATLQPRVAMPEDSWRVAQTCLALAVAHASHAGARAAMYGWDFSTLPYAEVFGGFRLEKALSSPDALAREVELVLDGATAVCRRA